MPVSTDVSSAGGLAGDDVRNSMPDRHALNGVAKQQGESAHKRPAALWKPIYSKSRAPCQAHVYHMLMQGRVCASCGGYVSRGLATCISDTSTNTYCGAASLREGHNLFTEERIHIFGAQVQTRCIHRCERPIPGTSACGSPCSLLRESIAAAEREASGVSRHRCMLLLCFSRDVRHCMLLHC